MKFKIGQTITRHDPGGHETTFSIQNSKDVQYHTDLAARGYKYEDISKGDGMSFDLPEVSSTAPTAPRVHLGGDTCVSCEG